MQTYLAKTMAGLEPVLMAELEALGATGVRPLKRAVSFVGDQALLYRANYALRTALRVLVPVHSFPAYNERSLYEALREVDWRTYLDPGGTLAVDAIATGTVFRHSHYLALLTKDAIVDQFRDRFHRRPNVNTEAPSLRVNIHVNGTHVELSIDASGESLHRRGFRKDTVEAPLNEVLAAGMVLMTDWNGRGPFVDPMCGSGTLAIEAALIALNIAPQYRRPSFGFMHWPDYSETLWNFIKREVDSHRAPSFEFPIVASDKDSRARNATAINLMAAGLEDHVRVDKIPFEEQRPPADGVPGVLVTNPPYDERLKVEAVNAFYKQIGDQLKQHWQGWDAWLISANRDALKNVGLRPSRRITLFNGALECSFQKFELYAGSKKKVEENEPA